MLITIYEIENLGLSNSKMLEIVKNYDKEERENDIRPPPKQRDFKQEKMIAEMTIFLSDINNRILIILTIQGSSLELIIIKGLKYIKL